MQFKKISIPPPQNVSGNSKGRGGGVAKGNSAKVKVLKGKHGAKLEFPEGWHGQTKKP